MNRISELGIQFYLNLTKKTCENFYRDKFYKLNL